MKELTSEIYYYIEGLDETILKINPFIKDLHYEFQNFQLSDFEKKFIKFFTLEDEYEKYGKEGTHTNGKMYYSSTAFKHGLENSYLVNRCELESRGYILLLKDYNKNSNFLFNSFYEIMSKEEMEDMNKEQKRDFVKYKKAKTSIENFVDKLRLIKQGHLRLISAFKIEKDNTFIGSLNPYLKRFDIAKPYPLYKTFCLSEEDIKEFSRYINDNLKMPLYLDTAFKSFVQSYNIDDPKVKFLLLMMSLESIYNANERDIRKTLSRHVALTISKNKKEYDEIYNEIYSDKDGLYSIRSLIVHGNTKEENIPQLKQLNDDLITLEAIVRRVIRKIKWCYHPKLNIPTKERLYDYLNTKPIPI